MYPTKKNSFLLLLFIFFFSLPSFSSSTDSASSIRVLLFTESETTPSPLLSVAITSLQNSGAALGWTVNWTDTSEVAFGDSVALAQYDVVVFLLTKGSVLTVAQRNNLQAWYTSGKKGWVGINSALETETDWQWYHDLLGANSSNSIPTSTNPLRLRVADQVHPSTEHLDANWWRSEALYNFVQSSKTIRLTNHVLFDVDENTMDGGKMGFDHPVAWCKEYQKGNSIYTSLGGSLNSWTDDNTVQHFIGAIGWAGGVLDGDCTATLDSLYQKEDLYLFGVGEQPMHLAALPDGRIIFITRQGFARVFKPDSGEIIESAWFNVATDNEDGLLGVLVDPGFTGSTGYLYFYWSPAGQPAGSEANVLSRFAMEGDIIDTNTRKDLLSIHVQRQICCHSGGGMAWDNDGNLLLSVGDNTDPFEADGFSPLDERAGRTNYDSQTTSGNTNDLRGKLLRIKIENPLVGDPYYTIPEGNLFTADALHRPEIYAMGLRNPFRIAADEVNGEVFLGEVGPDALTDDPRGPRGYDLVNRVKKNQPVNFGWPYCRANTQPYVHYNYATDQYGATFDCNHLENHSPNNKGSTTLPPATSSLIWYGYTDTPAWPEMNSDIVARAAMALHTFRKTDYIDPEQASYRLPDYFQQGTLLFGDWARDRMQEIIFDENRNLLKINVLWPSFTFKHPIDALVSKVDGSVYIIEFGTDYIGTGAQLSRMRYVKQANNPTCVISTGDSSTAGATPLVVDFSGASSTDPNGGSLTYSWDFQNDGVVDWEGVEKSWTYTASGLITVKLTVTNTLGYKTSCTKGIVAGNTRALISLDLPLSGMVFHYNANVTYRLSVADVEDGSTKDGGIDCSSVIVTPGLGHSDHVHDGIPLAGCHGSFLPGKEDAIGRFFTIIKAAYHDRGFLGSTTKEGALDSVMIARLKPDHEEAENFDDSFGVESEQTGDTTGYYDLAFIDDGDWTMYEAYNLFGIDNVTIRAAANNDPGSTGYVDIRINSLTGRLIGSIFIPNTGGWQNWKDFTGPVEDTNQWFEIDMLAVKSIQRIQISSSTQGTHPRGFAIYLSSNPIGDSRRYAAPYIDHSVSGNITADALTVQVIDLDIPKSCRFIRIVQTGEDNDNEWWIDEIDIFAQVSSSTPYSKTGWTASASTNSDSATDALDSDSTTTWKSGETQRSGSVSLYFIFRAQSWPNGIFNFNYFTFNGVGGSTPIANGQLSASPTHSQLPTHSHTASHSKAASTHSRSPSRTPSHGASHTRTPTHTISHPVSNGASHTRTPTHTISHPLSKKPSPTHSTTKAGALTPSHSKSRSRSHSRSVSPSHTRTRTRTRTHTRSRAAAAVSHSRTHSRTRTASPSRTKK